MRGIPLATPPSISDPQGLREFCEVVHEDLRLYGWDLARPGLQAILAYRLGYFRRGIANPIIRKPLSAVYRFLYRRARNRYGIELYDTSSLGRRLRIVHQSGIVIHNYAVVGDDCLIRQGVTLGGGVDYEAGDHPTLGRDVRIGVGAVLMGRFTVGDGARIGPNAVVSSNVTEGSVVVCPPARTFRRGST